MRRIFYILFLSIFFLLFVACSVVHRRDTHLFAIDGSTLAFKQKFNAHHNLKELLSDYESKLYNHSSSLIQDNDDLFMTDAYFEASILDSVINHSHRLLKDAPNDATRISLYEYLGKAYYYKQQYYTSISYFDAIKKISKSGKSYLDHWQCKNKLKLGNYFGAKSLIDSLTSYNNKSLDVFSLKASYYKKTAMRDSSIYFLEKSISNSPNSLEKHRRRYILAKTYVNQNDTLKAISNLKKILNSDAHQNLYVASTIELAYLTSKTIEGRKDAITNLLKIYDHTTDSYLKNQLILTLGKLYLDAKDEITAVSYFDKLSNFDFLKEEDKVNVLKRFATIYNQLGNMKKADSLLLLARELSATSPFEMYDDVNLRLVNRWPDTKPMVNEIQINDTFKSDTSKIILNHSTNSAETSDLNLFKNDDTYYFAIPVYDTHIHLSSSRYRIGQFNRNNANYKDLKHQISSEISSCQLLLIGKFKSLADVISYENRIVSLLPELMKIAPEKYANFVIRMDMVSSLKDNETLAKYLELYNKNKYLLHNKDEERIKK